MYARTSVRRAGEGRYARPSRIAKLFGEVGIKLTFRNLIAITQCCKCVLHGSGFNANVVLVVVGCVYPVNAISIRAVPQANNAVLAVLIDAIGDACDVLFGLCDCVGCGCGVHHVSAFLSWSVGPFYTCQGAKATICTNLHKTNTFYSQSESQDNVKSFLLISMKSP